MGIGIARLGVGVAAWRGGLVAGVTGAVGITRRIGGRGAVAACGVV